MSRDHLDELIARGLAVADDEVRAAWERIRIEPQRWQCSPWSDATGGFWAVAIIDRRVVWYNEIEEGFNSSPFTEIGRIDEYLCNQTELEDLLRTLPEAGAAEECASRSPDSTVPPSLQSGGSIVRRQTTYWTIEDGAGQPWRVRFSGKAEMRFTGPTCSNVTLFDAHPLLEHHNAAWSDLFLAGTAGDASVVARALESSVQVHSGGWRQFREYGSPSLLTLGYGLLLRGPADLVQCVAAVLDEHGIAYSIIGRHPAGVARRVLLMGSSFVVARAFRFERMDALG